MLRHICTLFFSQELHCPLNLYHDGMYRLILQLLLVELQLLLLYMAHTFTGKSTLTEIMKKEEEEEEKEEEEREEEEEDHGEREEEEMNKQEEEEQCPVHVSTPTHSVPSLLFVMIHCILRCSTLVVLLQCGIQHC